jgi:single-stranded DNA-specific DHH superfamily exonuclease
LDIGFLQTEFIKMRSWWLTPVIAATQEAEIRTEVRSQPRQTVYKTLSQKYPSQKRAGGVAQGEGPEFKPQYCKKKKKKRKDEVMVESGPL